ncbi:MAG: stage II sporulation protein M [Clostridiales bacterium]|nr:stage II sporulation protein M [Clostridiales bacterium]
MNIIKIKTDIMLHIEKNILFYLLLIFVFITGVAAGGFTINYMDLEQQGYLAEYLYEHSYLLKNQANIDKALIFLNSVFRNVQTAFFIWLFGLHYAGIPFMLITVGIRGFLLGFTVAFFIDYYGFNGFLFVIGCILPQCFVYVPCIVIMGIISLQSGIQNFRNRRLYTGKRIRFQRITGYTVKFLFIIIAFLLAGLFETFIVPFIFKALFANFFLNKGIIHLILNRSSVL